MVTFLTVLGALVVIVLYCVSVAMVAVGGVWAYGQSYSHNPHDTVLYTVLGALAVCVLQVINVLAKKGA